MNILELGCGENPFPFKTGLGTIERIDLNSSFATTIHDLDQFPYPLKAEHYDLIYAAHCLEHLQNKNRFFPEIHRLLKTGGKLIIRVPHFSSLKAYAYEHLSFWAYGSLSSLVSGEKSLFKMVSKSFYWRINDFKKRPLRGFPEKEFSANKPSPQKLRMLVNQLLSGFLTRHPYLSEKILHFFIFGIDEIEYILEKR